MKLKTGSKRGENAAEPTGSLNRARRLARTAGALILLLGCVCQSAAAVDTRQVANPPGRDTLLFRNGDLLYGKLDSIDPQHAIRWRHSDVEELIEFRPENISEIQFSPVPGAVRGPGELSRLQLQNGDELEGSIASFDRDNVLLQTWYAGQVTIPRDWVKLIVPVLPEGATLFNGPSGLDGWTMGKAVSALGDAGQWHYRSGAFYATNAASIARDVNLPDVGIIEFDLNWQGLFQMAIALYTDYLHPINLVNKETEPDFGGFYSLQLNSFSANLLVVKKDDPLRYLGQVSVPGFNQKNSARIEIRASKPKRSVALLVDGHLVKQWIDSEGFAGEGTCIRMVHQGQGKVRMSNIRVAEWDGHFDDTPPAQFSHKQDLAKLRNGDKVSGHLQTIKDGKLVIALEQSMLEIPLSRVKQVEMAAKPAESALPPKNFVRAFFKRGGFVTFELDSWENNRVSGVSAKLGPISIDSAAFSRVEVDLKAFQEQAAQRP
jgi:hypothetical protein